MFSSRLVARLFDFSLLFFLCYALLNLFQLSLGLVFLLSLTCSSLLYFPCYGGMIALLKITPGHVFWQITLCKSGGQRLSFKEALGYLFNGVIENTQLVSFNKMIPHKILSLTIVILFSLTLCSPLLFSPYMRSISYSFSHKGMVAYDPVENWVRYQAAERDFCVSFPSNPELEMKHFDVRRVNDSFDYEEYCCQIDKKVCYSVGCVDFPGAWRLIGANKLLKEFLNVILEEDGELQLLSSESIEFNGMRGIDYHLQKGDKKISARLLINKSTLYRLSIEYQSHQEIAQLHHGDFLESFELGS